jgi:shikimate dehydrogenase
MNITAKTKLCMVVGDPVEHSLGPQMHNVAYEKVGLAGQYVYVAAHVNSAAIGDFINGVRAMSIRGVSCTTPHKVTVMQYLDKLDLIAEKIGAVNTVVNDEGILTGYNTDWLGVVIPLEQLTSLKDKKVALLGAGGAARAIAYGVSSRGGQLTIYNRNQDKGGQLAADFGTEIGSFDDLDTLKTMDIIINATSLGMFPRSDTTPLPKECLTGRQIVFDIVYTPYETRLLREAREQGARVIHGSEMLLHQGLAQFKLFTGHDAPEEPMRAALLEALQARGTPDA